MPAKKKPSKYYLFTQTKPDTKAVLEYIIAESLIQFVKFNGVNCVEIFLRGGDKISITKDAKTIFERLREELSPAKIN